MDCMQNKAKILQYIEEEIALLQEGCPQDTCPMSNLERGKYATLLSLKEYVEGLSCH